MGGQTTDGVQGGFDRAAAVTRSLLGYGVIAGPVYLVVALAQALVRDGFELTRHSVSLLANGPGGWVQVTNFIVVGLMVVAAAVGFARAMGPARLAGALLGVYGLSLVASGVFGADPMDGFPPGTPGGPTAEMSTGGLLHLAAGGIGFFALAAAFVVIGGWFARRGDGRIGAGSRTSSVVVVLGFLSGAALSTTPVGVPALWAAVLVGWGWLIVSSVALYRTVPHPDAEQRIA